MHQDIVTPEATDALYDASPASLAVRFGLRAIELIRNGGQPYVAARLAFSFAERVIDAPESLEAACLRLASEKAFN